MQDLFPQLPANARVWVYQSNRVFTAEETSQIQQAIDQFVAEWSSHSRDVIAAGALLHNRFLVLVADETEFTVSGCSIDSSVAFVKRIAQQYQVDFFDRMQVAWIAGEEVHSADRVGFEKALSTGDVTENTIVFNNMITTKDQLLTSWQIPLKDSWHARVFA